MSYTCSSPARPGRGNVPLIFSQTSASLHTGRLLLKEPRYTTRAFPFACLPLMRLTDHLRMEPVFMASGQSATAAGIATDPDFAISLIFNTANSPLFHPRTRRCNCIDSSESNIFLKKLLKFKTGIDLQCCRLWRSRRKH
jgi:hypothetical protein